MEVLILEDEARIAGQLKKIVTELLSGTLDYINVRHELQDGIDLLNYRNIDVLFLDLNLNGESGFDLLNEFTSRNMHVVIVSAHANEAIKAFEFGVTDFIAKPFNRERIKKALDRILQSEKNVNYYVKNLAVRKNQKFQMISPTEIYYIKGAGPYSELYLKNGRKELSDKSLEKLYMILPQSFERVHRSFILNMSEVKSIRVSSGTKYEAELKTGQVIPIGRTKYKLIKQKWL